MVITTKNHLIWISASSQDGMTQTRFALPPGTANRKPQTKYMKQQVLRHCVPGNKWQWSPREETNEVSPSIAPDYCLQESFQTKAQGGEIETEPVCFPELRRQSRDWRSYSSEDRIPEKREVCREGSLKVCRESPRVFIRVHQVCGNYLRPEKKPSKSIGGNNASSSISRI